MTKRLCGIYQIKNIVTGKVYIGQSINIRRRKVKHFSELKSQAHDNAYLQRSYNKHGKKSFKFEVLELCDKDLLTERELYYYDKVGKEGRYNLSIPGETPTQLTGKDHPRYGKKLSKETREKMSKSRSGKLNHMWGKSGKKSPNSKPVIKVDIKTGETLGTFCSFREASKSINIDESAISRCVNGYSNSSGGYKWKLAN